MTSVSRSGLLVVPFRHYVVTGCGCGVRQARVFLPEPHLLPPSTGAVNEQTTELDWLGDRRRRVRRSGGGAVPAPGHDPRRRTHHHTRLRGLPAGGDRLGPPPGVPDLRARGLLRHLAAPARPCPLAEGRPSRCPLVRAGRGLGLVLCRRSVPDAGFLSAFDLGGRDSTRWAAGPAGLPPLKEPSRAQPEQGPGWLTWSLGSEGGRGAGLAGPGALHRVRLHVVGGNRSVAAAREGAADGVALDLRRSVLDGDPVGGGDVSADLDRTDDRVAPDLHATAVAVQRHGAVDVAARAGSLPAVTDEDESRARGDRDGSSDRRAVAEGE